MSNYQCLNCGACHPVDQLEEQSGVWADLMAAWRGLGDDDSQYACPSCGSVGCLDGDGGETLFAEVDGDLDEYGNPPVICPSCDEAVSLAEVQDVFGDGDQFQCPACYRVTPSDDWGWSEASV